MDKKEYFFAKVDRIKLEHDLTDQQLAENLGLSRSMLSAMRAGTKNISHKSELKLERLEEQLSAGNMHRTEYTRPESIRMVVRETDGIKDVLERIDTCESELREIRKVVISILTDSGHK